MLNIEIGFEKFPQVRSGFRTEEAFFNVDLSPTPSMLSPSKARRRGRVARDDDGTVSRSTTNSVRPAHQTITISADGLRQTITGSHSTKRRRINPEDLRDPYAGWVPGHFDADLNDGVEGLSNGEDSDGGMDPVPEVTVNVAKRKRYLSSVSISFLSAEVY